MAAGDVIYSYYGYELLWAQKGVNAKEERIKTQGYPTSLTTITKICILRGSRISDHTCV